MTGPVRFSLDGRTIGAAPGETIWQAAERAGTVIPHLCYTPRRGYRADGNCRLCMVEIAGERVLAASCQRAPTDGMAVRSASGRAAAARAMVMELLLADQPARERAHDPDSELWRWADAMGCRTSRFPAREAPAADLSHPAMAVNLDACIHCTRCVRACREVQVNDVIGMARRGARSEIVFDMGDAMGDSTCVACGECVQACPTGALLPASGAVTRADREVDSLCPYCGVGCQLTFHVRNDRILRAEGRDGPANQARLCVKGRFGFDYARHPNRLTQPLIRLAGAPKRPGEPVDPADPRSHFRAASWDEALERAAAGFLRIREAHGGAALAGFGSAKGSNEGSLSCAEDDPRRVRHEQCRSLHAAVPREFGRRADGDDRLGRRDGAFCRGRKRGCHHGHRRESGREPPGRGDLFQERGAARRRTARHRPARPGAEAPCDDNARTAARKRCRALLNALAHVIVGEGLHDARYVQARTRGFAALAAHLADYSPEAMAPLCGISAARLRMVARTYARAERAIIFWGMGVSQHVHGTDNARCLINLALLCGHVGRPGTGLHPLRGQNNVQGASDAGLIPMVYPDYRPVGDPEAHAWFEAFWGASLDPEPGLTVVEIADAAFDRRVKGLYVMGENPAMSDPDASRVREALCRLEHLVVQDIFLTETAAFADVVLPATAFPEKTGSFTNTDRRVQMGRRAVDPPGAARQDWWIVQEIARRLGLDWSYGGPADIHAEMRACMPSIKGITWERLMRESAVTYPCDDETQPGQEIMFGDGYPTAGGRGQLTPVALSPPDERPDPDYPFVLTTGRQLEHWHTGQMTRRAAVLDALEPEAVCEMSPEDARRLGLEAGADVRLTTRRGAVKTALRISGRTPDGVVFLPFCYAEAAANLLTNAALDPFGKIPELKYCAVRVEAAP